MNGNPLVFDCVDELYRVTRAEGHTIYMYSFFVLKTKNYSIVFNIRTLKYIEVSYENIIPTNFTFRKKDYTTIFETTIIRHSPEYLCVDNSIFDENLTELAKISTRWDAKPILLDICDCFIAVTDFRGVINIFKWTPYNKTKVEECLYYFKSSENTNDVSLVVEDEFSNNIMSFDPIKKRFVVKAECIDKKLDIKTIDYDESNDYSIMDALDGDPEAYGNID
jgi:hypothetical protein